MVTTPDRAVMRWLFTFSGIVAVLVVYGGFVRLTRSGLSIVEWKPVTGVIPPIGEQAWRDAFAEYRRTPEFIHVNSSMTLGEFQQIFTIEWLHRLIARLAGFAYAIPFFTFLALKRIPRRDLGVYLVMGSLFVLQAIAGWVMVASGLRDRPSVSHINLAVHLLMALSLFALALWTALDHRFWPSVPRRRARWSLLSWLTAGFVGVLLVQIAYGGFTAGLKAGHVSDTWPKMFGSWLPSGLFSSLTDLVATPATIVFIHRWFAFVVATVALVLGVAAFRRQTDAMIRRGVVALASLVCLQIVLGITTVLTSVNEVLALSHQSTAVAILAAGLFVLHRVRALDARQDTGPADVIDQRRRPTRVALTTATASAAATDDPGEIITR